MADATPKVEPKTEPKEEPAETAQRSANTEFRHPDQVMMPDTPMTEAASATPAPPLADDNDEESSSEEAGDDDLQSEEELESAPDAAERLQHDKEDQEAIEGLSNMFDQITNPRNAEETIRANRAGSRASEAPPLTTRKSGTTLDGYAPAGPSIEDRPRHVHFAEYVNEAEARRQQAAELKALIGLF